jgi:hypothetical protein
MSALAPSLAIDLDPAVSAFFLGRLAALVVRQTCAPTAHERTALAQVAFAIFLDCLDLGLGEEARSILGCLQIEPTAMARIVA